MKRVCLYYDIVNDEFVLVDPNIGNIGYYSKKEIDQATKALISQSLINEDFEDERSFKGKLD